MSPLFYTVGASPSVLHREWMAAVLQLQGDELLLTNHLLSFSLNVLFSISRFSSSSDGI